nr:hypothetical protein [uncultured Ruminococcus sp.]
MMTKRKLRERVDSRRKELEAESERFSELRGRLISFAEDIKTHTVIYNMLRNLPLWKELENLLGI